MATESEKKNQIKETGIAFDKRDQGYCEFCLYTWCSLRNKVTYCSFQYKGELGYLCETVLCKAK